MLTGLNILMVFIALTVIIAVICAELLDRVEAKRQRRSLRDGFRCTGKVIRIWKISRSDYGGNRYPWRMKVEFEFEGRKYIIEHISAKKPDRTMGDCVMVFVDAEKPSKSVILS